MQNFGTEVDDNKTLKFKRSLKKKLILIKFA